jgi:hypothetical protein
MVSLRIRSISRCGVQRVARRLCSGGLGWKAVALAEPRHDKIEVLVERFLMADSTSQSFLKSWIMHRESIQRYCI